MSDAATLECLRKLRDLRIAITKSAAKAGTGHIAAAFSVLEIVYTLYTKILRVNPINTQWPDRDRFIMSKGHGALAQYTVLEMLGFISKDDLYSFAQRSGSFGCHTTLGTPGVEATTGSLGHGLAIGMGMALAGKYDQKDYRVFVVLSDGECQEGSVWEAALAIPSFKLDNLVAIIDYNGLQPSGRVLDILPAFEPLKSKWEAFGWAVEYADGHDTEKLQSVFQRTPFVRNKPSMVIAKTVKGKGMSFMENNPVWHHKFPNSEEVARMLKELEESI